MSSPPKRIFGFLPVDLEAPAREPAVRSPRPIKPSTPSAVRAVDEVIGAAPSGGSLGDQLKSALQNQAGTLGDARPKGANTSAAPEAPAAPPQAPRSVTNDAKPEKKATPKKACARKDRIPKVAPKAPPPSETAVTVRAAASSGRDAAMAETATLGARDAVTTKIATTSARDAAMAETATLSARDAVTTKIATVRPQEAATVTTAASSARDAVTTKIATARPQEAAATKPSISSAQKTLRILSGIATRGSGFINVATGAAQLGVGMGEVLEGKWHEGGLHLLSGGLEAGAGSALALGHVALGVQLAGAGVFIDGAIDLARGASEDDGEAAAIGAAKVLGGAGMMAPHPLAQVAGGVVAGIAEAVEHREEIGRLVAAAGRWIEGARAD